MIETMPDWLYHTLFPVTRWLHLVATALLVGGVLFYEFVIPRALDEMKDEHQLAVFGRVRWFFSKVVYISALIILVTGAVSAWKAWDTYQQSHSVETPGFWFVLHAGLGLITLAIALRLTLSPRMPPLSWMRVNFILMLVVIFLAGVARHVQTAVAPAPRPTGGTGLDDVRGMRRAYHIPPTTLTTEQADVEPAMTSDPAVTSEPAATSDPAMTTDPAGMSERDTTSDERSKSVTTRPAE